jgi:iron complex transport system ATP-binding protein
VLLSADDVWFAYRRRRGAPAPPGGIPAAEGRDRTGNGDGWSGLKGISLRVEPRSRVGLLGANGSGKTTFLRVLGGTLKPDRGRVTLDGEDVRRLSRRFLARRIASVPQETHLAFDYTVLEIALMGRYPHLGPFELEGANDLAIARDALLATGTAALERRSFATLSGGEKQRVIIASALAQSAGLMLLDEPTASLDLGYQLEIAALLRHLNADRGITLVVATHDLNFAASVCNELLLLKDGTVLAAGPVEQVLTGEHVRQLYRVEADVRFHEDAGHMTVVPLRRVAEAGRPERRGG